MTYIQRIIGEQIQQAFNRGKSVLLLGARQTGKTTLIETLIQPNIIYSFASAQVRLRYERDLGLFEKELEQQTLGDKKLPIIFIDEVQKIPAVMDIVQHLIDQKLAKFILTGSSARKLKVGTNINLLPGRVVVLLMSPLLYDELPEPKPSLEEILLYGTLPGIIMVSDRHAREKDLYSYVTTYLEEEIRAEALIRNVGHFSRFLEIAAGESGKQVNFTRLSQDIGVADTTIANYYQILEDCLITARIDPITNSPTKRRLIKSPKYLFFDLGIRRACANEGRQLPHAIMTNLFEHFVGNELIKHSELISLPIKVKYWRDLSGPEIDYVLDIAHQYVPIEVKWSDKPNKSDAKHLMKFIKEYSNVEKAYIVCRTPRAYKINEQILALPWQDIATIFS